MHAVKSMQRKKGVLASCKDTSKQNECGMQPFEYRSVRYWSKEINVTRTGGIICNAHKIPLLDARTTAEYELYQGRLYVNCTNFPSY